jgi:haloalkane dehalogenase
VLCLHGEPSWSFLYRHMVPLFAEAGLRAVAPDLVGFGRSDKPSMRTDYSYQRHVSWMSDWLEAVDLRDITLVCQDWGSLIGLRLAAEDPDRFARIVLANGGLPTGDVPAGEAFQQWLKLSQEVPELPVGQLIAGASGGLPAEVIAGYDAPYPDDSFKEGARIFPTFVPITPDDPAAEANRRAWEVFRAWDKPFLTAFSDGDPITRGGDRIFQDTVPGAKGQPHTTIEGAGHFLQETHGPALARVTIDFIAGS